MKPPISEVVTSITTIDNWIQARSDIQNFHKVVSSTVQMNYSMSELASIGPNHIEVIAKQKKRSKAERYVYNLEGLMNEEYKNIADGMEATNIALNSKIKVKSIDNKLVWTIIGVIVAALLSVAAIFLSVRSSNKLVDVLEDNHDDLMEVIKAETKPPKEK